MRTNQLMVPDVFTLNRRRKRPLLLIALALGRHRLGIALMATGVMIGMIYNDKKFAMVLGRV